MGNIALCCRGRNSKTRPVLRLSELDYQGKSEILALTPLSENQKICTRRHSCSEIPKGWKWINGKSDRHEKALAGPPDLSCSGLSQTAGSGVTPANCHLSTVIGSGGAWLMEVLCEFSSFLLELLSGQVKVSSPKPPSVGC